LHPTSPRRQVTHRHGYSARAVKGRLAAPPFARVLSPYIMCVYGFMLYAETKRA